MKTAYNTFSTETWKMFKSVSSKRTESDCCEFAGRMWKKAFDVLDDAKANR